jgi:hypothetical protein
MCKEWLEEHYKALRVLLLVLAALNGWIAYAILPEHSIMALANGVMAVLIILGVILSRRVGGPG